MKKLLKIFAILMISALVFSCGGSGGSAEGDAPVKVSFTVDTPHSDIAKTVSVNNPSGSFTYWYKAVPVWTGADFATIKGSTNGQFVQINNYGPGADIGYFAQGTWKFYAQVKSGDNVVYESAADPDITYINASSTTVSVDVVRTGNGSATVTIDIEVPIVSAGTVLTATYGTGENDYIGLTKTTMDSNNDIPTHGAGWARFKGSKTLAAGAYEFTLTSNNGSADVGGAVLAFDVVGGVSRAISGTIENGVWQTVFITINLPKFTVTNTAAGSATTVAPSTNLTFTCHVDSSNIDGTVEYQWYVNDSPIDNATGETFVFNKSAQGFYYVTSKAYIAGKISGSHTIPITVTN